jgi:hypothetical protein
VIRRDWYYLDFVDRGFVLYAHNMNIGGFVVYATTMLGFNTIIPSAIVTAVAYATGIYFAFKFGKAATGSRILGNWFGLFMATDVLYGLSWGMNLIRGWHWLAIFAAWLAVLRLAESGGRRYIALLVVGSVTTFLIGLDFTTLVAPCMVALALAFASSWRRRITVAGLVGGIFAALFFLRQLQIIGGLGVATWWMDLVYTFGLKIPQELRWFTIPDEATISAWYRDQHLGRGGTAAYRFADRMDLSVFTDNLHTWRHLEIIAPVFFLGAASLLVLRALRRDVNRRGPRALLALTIGAAIGSTLFFDHFWGYFVRLGFPFLSTFIYRICSAWQAGSVKRRGPGDGAEKVEEALALLACGGEE